MLGELKSATLLAFSCARQRGNENAKRAMADLSSPNMSSPPPDRCLRAYLYTKEQSCINYKKEMLSETARCGGRKYLHVLTTRKRVE